MTTDFLPDRAAAAVLPADRLRVEKEVDRMVDSDPSVTRRAALQSADHRPAGKIRRQGEEERNGRLGRRTWPGARALFVEWALCPPAQR